MNNSLVIKRTNFYFLLKLLIAAGVIYYLIASINIKDLFLIIKSADSFLLIFALILLPLNIYLQFLKWKIAADYYLGPSDRNKILFSLFTGFAGGIFTPARAGEYAGRGVEFKNKSVKEIAAAVFSDKICTMIFIFIFGLIGSTLYIEYYYSAAGLILLFLAYAAVRNYFPRWSKKLHRISLIQKIYEWFSDIKSPDKKFIKQQLIFSLFYYIVFCIQFGLLLAAFSEGEIIPLFFMIAACVIFVKTIIPNFISGEFGIRESASVFFMSLSGFKPEAGFNAAAALFLINMVLPSVFGLMLLLRKNND